MTADILERAEALLASVTEGPWEQSGDLGDWALDGPGLYSSIGIVAPGEDLIGILAGDYLPGRTDTTLDANARFIAWSREGVPDLIAEVRRLREALVSAGELSAQLAARPAPEDAGLVERLQEPIIADAFERRAITDGLLAERLVKERIEAADRIEVLSRQLAEVTRERDGLWECVGAEARRYAGFYKPHSDGQNTFVMFAEWAERHIETPPAPALDALDVLAQVEAEVRELMDESDDLWNKALMQVVAIIRRAREGQQ